MLKSLLDDFNIQIDNSKKYINYLDNIWTMSKDKKFIKNKFFKSVIDFHRENSTEKKLFEHKAIIINLYGILEKTISIWIVSYVDSISKIHNKYSNLDEKLKLSHFDLSIRLINLIDTKSKYSKYSKDDVIKNLNNLIVNPEKDGFKLNSCAYIPESGNLKYAKILEAFKLVNIDLKIELQKRIENIKILELEKKIDLLVTYRNDVAHGNDIDNIINIKEFIIYVDCLSELGNLVFKILESKELNYKSKFHYEELKLFKLHYKCWLEVDLENQNVKLGDSLIMKYKDCYSKVNIIEIDINKTNYQNIFITSKSNIWIKIDQDADKKAIFFIKKIINVDRNIKYPLITKDT
ncbi:MAE_28990/MAE_18760 family HEPN-like nuclease [Aliarcobacter butzleri]